MTKLFDVLYNCGGGGVIVVQWKTFMSNLLCQSSNPSPTSSVENWLLLVVCRWFTVRKLDKLYVLVFYTPFNYPSLCN